MNIDLPAHRLVVVIVALGALMAGMAVVAGGADDDRPSRDVTNNHVTRATYVTAADQLCTELNGQFKVLNARIRRVFEVHTDEADALRAVADLVKRGYRQRRAGRARFHDLKVPRADRIVIQMIRTLYDRQTTVVGRLADTAARGDITGFAALTLQLRRLVAQARELASGYGFRVCGRDAVKPDVARPASASFAPRVARMHQDPAGTGCTATRGLGGVMRE